MPFLPTGFGIESAPVFAILGHPGISPVFRRLIRPTTHQPNMIPVNNRRKPKPFAPRCINSFPLPVDTIRGRPDIVVSKVFWNIIPTAKDIDFIIENRGLMVGPWCPGSAPSFELPILAIGRRPNIILKAVFIAKVIVFGTSENPKLSFELNNC